MKKRLQTWGEIEEGMLLYFKGDQRMFQYVVMDKDWKTRSIRVIFRRPEWKRKVLILRMYSIPRWLSEGRLLRRP